MKFQDFFDINVYLFNSILAWNEEENVYGPNCGWILNYDDINLPLNYSMFYINAKYQGEKNLYEEFLNRYFFVQLEGILNSKSMSRSQYPIINIYEDYSGNKHIVFDLNFYCNNILNAIELSGFNSKILEYNNDYEQKILNFKNALREERKCLVDVLNNKKNSIYYDKMLEIFENEKEKYGNSINGINITFDNLVESKISFCTKMIVACRYLKDFFEKELDTNKLTSCFDYDIFCLLLAKSFFEQMIYNGKVSSSTYFLLNYFQKFDEYKNKNPKYNPKIKIFNGQKYEIISANDLRNKFFKTLEQHPEFNYWEVNIEEIKEYFMNEIINGKEIDELTIKDFTSLIRMLHKKDTYEETDREVIKISVEKLEEVEKNAIDQNQIHKIRQQKDKIEFLLQNNPIKIIRGKGTFSNYYGYVYENGYVVFDVLNDDLNKSYGNASYIIPYTQIFELADVKKTDLRKLSSYDITTIIHKGNWKDKILQKLNEVVPREIDFSSISSIDISGVVNIEKLEELKQKYRDNAFLISKIEKRKEEIKKIYEDIDNQLKETPASDENEDKLKDIEEEIISSSINPTDFYAVNNVKLSVKPSRDIWVSLNTKFRTEDERGAMHCEMCGEFESSDTRQFAAHHIIPLSQGGIDNLYNTACLCGNCHNRIHSKKYPPTYEERWNMLKNVRKNIEKSTPNYLEKFDRIFNPYYNAIYHKKEIKTLEEEMTAKELNELYNYYEEIYQKENEYYQTHKEEEDLKFLIEWNNFRKR